MPKYPTAADRAHEARTLLAALSIVRLGGLKLDRTDPVLPPNFSRFLIASNAGLLIAPSVVTNGSDRHSAAAAMRLLRLDAIIVRISRRPDGSNIVIVDVGLERREPVWLEEYRPSLVGGQLHLALSIVRDAPTFSLGDGHLRSLDPRDVPSRQIIEEGFETANQLFHGEFA